MNLKLFAKKIVTFFNFVTGKYLFLIAAIVALIFSITTGEYAVSFSNGLTLTIGGAIAIVIAVIIAMFAVAALISLISYAISFICYVASFAVGAYGLISKLFASSK